MKSINLHYISDLHLEKHPLLGRSLLQRAQTSKVPKHALFIAGDLGHPCRPEFKDFLHRASDLWPSVFFVAGNHEYDMTRNSDEMTQVDQQIDEIATERENIHVLREGRAFSMGEYTVIGSTLWTYTLYKTWRQTERNARHIEESEFLRRTIENSNTPLIVMTHYLPSYRLIHPYYMQRCSELDRWASVSDHLLAKPVKFWFAGHTHSIYDGMLYEVHVLINAGSKQIRYVSSTF